MIRSLRGVVVIALVALMAACSPYPGEGVVDTRDIREKGDVEEITGKAFGIKEGADNAALAMHDDIRFIWDLEDQAWAHVVEGKELPTLTLAYADVSSEPVKQALSMLVEEAKAKQAAVKAEIAEDVAELEAKKQEQIAKRDEAKAGASGYEAAVAEAKGAYQKADSALKSAIQNYNEAIAAPVAKLNVLAKEKGLSTIPEYRNPIKSYRYSSFEDGNKPSSCQRARNKFVVNMLDSHNQCMYFNLPEGYAKYDSQVTEILKSSILNMEAATAELGERGGWNSDGTGAYADMAKAKKAYEQAVAKAREKFGDNRQREWTIRNAEQWIAKFQAQIDEKSSDAEYQKQIGWTNFYASDEAREKLNAYRDAMKEHFLANYMATLGDITKDPESSNGKFEVGGGYTHVVAVSDTLADFSGRKRVLRHYGVVDLTDPAVQEADAVTVNIAYRDLDGQPRDESLEKMQDGAIEQFMDMARKEAKKS